MKKISINLLVVFCSLAVFPFILQAQKTVEGEIPERVKQMKKLKFLAGSWSGSGWMITPKGERISFTIEENARFRLGNSILIVEGLGKSKGKVIHDALGFVKYDEKEKKFILEAFVANGNSVKMSPKVFDNKLVWGLKFPNGGQTRYTVVINEKGNWYEIGEYSPDGGKTWHRTMEMELSKVSK